MKRQLAKSVALMAMAVLLAGGILLGPAADAAPDRGTTFVGLVRNHPQTLDPAIGSDNPHLKFYIAAYEPLIDYKPGSVAVKDLTGVLATSWTISSDATTYTFKLRPGVRFHDGATLTPDDVKLSFERMRKINRGNAWALADLKDVQVVDRQTVRITLNRPSAAFLQAVPLVYIVSSKAVRDNERDGDLAQDWLRTRAAGTGPYKFDEWQRDQQLILSRFDQYWGGWSGRHFDRLVLRLVADQSTQRQIQEAGESDWADSVSAEDADQLAAGNKAQVHWNPSTFLLWLTMDTSKPPFNDVRVRRAMRHAFDYRATANRILRGHGKIPKGYVLPMFPEHDPSIGEERRDAGKAKQLLVEAGYGQGKPLSFTAMYFAPLDWERQALEAFGAHLRQLGGEIRMDGKPFATMIAAASSPQRPDMMFWTAGVPTGSLDSVFSQTWHSSSSHWSRYGYSNRQLDGIIEAARAEPNEAKRIQLYRQAQRILEADSPAVNAVIQDWSQVFSVRVQGFVHLPLTPAIVDYYLLSPR